MADRKFIGSMFCSQYKSEAKFYIELAHDDAPRQLVVIYETGGYEGRPEFKSGIPADWIERDVQDFLLMPMNRDAPHPIWEVPARAHGSATLFRWWAGEKPI